jgi:hypothetical protein
MERYRTDVSIDVSSDVLSSGSAYGKVTATYGCKLQLRGLAVREANVIALTRR